MDHERRDGNLFRFRKDFKGHNQLGLTLMHVEAGSGLRVMYSSISGMSRMVYANTVKAKSVGMG